MQLDAQVQPTGISGLVLWLDASDVNNGTANPADGSSVATWYDKSGSHNNAVTLPDQFSGKVYANQISGQPVVRFARTSGTTGTVYEVPGVDIRAGTLSAVTVFTVYRQTGQLGDQALWGDDNGGWERFFLTACSVAGAGNGLASLGPTNAGAAVTGAGIPGVTQLITAVYNYNVPNGSAVYFNGQNIVNFTDHTSLSAAQSDFRIGFDGDDNCYNGDIAEVIVYSRPLTACEIQQVNRYLGSKYGATFSTVSIIASGSTIMPLGNTVTLTSSVTGNAYQWLLNGVAISGATGSSYVAATAGNYRVAVTNNCTDTSAAETVIILTLLPVTLRDFTARQQAGYVLLQWSTASELNSARFVVERSSNGTDFTAIGTVGAAGRSSALLSYSTTDKAPVSGVNYYRLKQVDKDGNAGYSAVQQVVFIAGKAYVVVYPSPATDHLVVESGNGGLAGTTGIISDMQGRVVKKFVVAGNSQQVDISTLGKGVYHVELADKKVFRIVKE